MTLIRDLIDIPPVVHRGDFVLKLTEGVAKPAETVKNYVVTPELVKNFEDALAFIKGALEANTSKACYLHGSFGSGKSHFMAVLNLALEQDVHARSIPELASAIDKANAWTAGRKFLLVPYHMIGARNMEAGILGGYAEYIRRVHPEAPVPGVFLAEGLFADAQNLRRSMGDAAFFAKLSEGAEGESDWGQLDAAWDAERFETAINSPPGPDSEDRIQLVGKLVKTFFTSYQDVARTQEEAYIPLDDGLSVISKHAKSLGYDAVILFLDELVLWLASHAARLDFMHQEGQKLAKLVEAQRADRPIPLVSFVARQRDLADLVGDNITGSEKLNFSDALRHWEGRFHKITLEDRNLPAIAEIRVLKPKDDAAKEELDDAFEQSTKVRQDVMNALLTTKYDRDIFRKVYPFSPALVDTLIGVSSVLQRERTALKVMMLLLVAQRETLKVGDIVPVGDLFDVIAHGDEAFSQDMALQFENAKRLYHQKLLPLLEKQHNIRQGDVEALPYSDPRRVAFRADDRLVKTLLLAALVPGVESLKGLNANRLAALNHGTIKVPPGGTEGALVLQRCKAWASEVGEIKVGDEAANPSIRVQLTGVDTERIIEQARREDNHGNQVRLVRQMIFEQMGVDNRDEFFLTHEFTWRNTERTCEVIFGNIRSLPDSSLESGGNDWKLVIDFPFDEPGHSPQDDVARLQKFREDYSGGTRTLAWIPAFLRPNTRSDLGLLVILEHILTGERFDGYASILPFQDRPVAKALLENQRSQLRQRVLHHLEVAYGIDRQSTDSIDTAHELSEQFQSLWPAFDPQPPVAVNLKDAMQHLLEQALEHQYPAHPKFEAPPKGANLKKVYEEVQKATEATDGRIEVDKALRPLMRAIANPLLLGEMHETHFVLGQYWKNHFNPKIVEAGGTASVGQLRNWMDLPRPRGLPKPVQNLVILIFAEQTTRSFYLHSAPAEATLTTMSDQMELKPWIGPPDEKWKLAVQRAGSIFGLTPSPLLNEANVTELGLGTKKMAEGAQAACRNLCRALRDRLDKMGLTVAEAPRLKTATAVLSLVDRLILCHQNDVVLAIADAECVSSEAAMGKSLKSAGELVERLDATTWSIFDDVVQLPDEYQARAKEIRDTVCEALQADEYAVALASTLRDAQGRAVRLLAEAAKSKKPPKPEPDPDLRPGPGPTIAPPQPGIRLISEGSRDDLTADKAEPVLAQIQKDLKAKPSRRLSISWRIDEEGSEYGSTGSYLWSDSRPGDQYPKARGQRSSVRDPRQGSLGGTVAAEVRRRDLPHRAVRFDAGDAGGAAGGDTRRRAQGARDHALARRDRPGRPCPAGTAEMLPDRQLADRQGAVPGPAYRSAGERAPLDGRTPGRACADPRVFPGSERSVGRRDRVGNLARTAGGDVDRAPRPGRPVEVVDGRRELPAIPRVSRELPRSRQAVARGVGGQRCRGSAGVRRREPAGRRPSGGPGPGRGVPRPSARQAGSGRRPDGEVRRECQTQRNDRPAVGGGGNGSRAVAPSRIEDPSRMAPASRPDPGSGGGGRLRASQQHVAQRVRATIGPLRKDVESGPRESRLGGSAGSDGSVSRSGRA